MRLSIRLLLLAPLAGAVLLTSCTTMQPPTQRYHVTALKPKDPDKVRVDLSLSTQNVYVMEGDRLLMAVQGTVGKPGATTPKGKFRITNKIKNKRRISQPDAGYPMAYWCEFKPAYGFHEGFVHSSPRTHGCIRLHREAAARLFALVKVGTPVSIADSQPEDDKYGRQVMKLDQSRDPDPPRSEMMKASWFKDPDGPLLRDG
ncbi:MAG: L,D-transpeptidase [Chthoniobacterales bacterium]